MSSVSHNTQPWDLRLLVMTNKSFLGCQVFGTLSVQSEGEVLEMLPCFPDLVCGLNTFLTSSQNKTCSLMVLSRGALPLLQAGAEPYSGTKPQSRQMQDQNCGGCCRPHLYQIQTEFACQQRALVSSVQWQLCSRMSRSRASLRTSNQPSFLCGCHT